MKGNPGYEAYLRPAPAMEVLCHLDYVIYRPLHKHWDSQGQRLANCWRTISDTPLLFIYCIWVHMVDALW